MAATLCEVGPGDEVILPSYTFVSTANAFVARGATPVFADIRADTFTLDGGRVLEAITPRTKVIVPVHYAGVGCDLAPYLGVARELGITVVEDAAQAILSTRDGEALGSTGALAAFSFHETKNVSSGQGGALVVNDERYAARAEVIWEKGTDRASFERGEVDRYTWLDQGSCYSPGELVAAFLSAQMRDADDITGKRLALWDVYHRALEPLELEGSVRRPIIPRNCEHNGHMYYLLLRDSGARARLMEFLRARGITAVFHYVPLHSSPAGLRYGRAADGLTVTEDVAARLVRLPLWMGLEPEQDRVISAVLEFFASVGA